jgi:hypothetical protein
MVRDWLSSVPSFTNCPSSGNICLLPLRNRQTQWTEERFPPITSISTYKRRKEMFYSVLRENKHRKRWKHKKYSLKSFNLLLTITNLTIVVNTLYIDSRRTWGAVGYSWYWGVVRIAGLLIAECARFTRISQKLREKSIQRIEGIARLEVANDEDFRHSSSILYILQKPQQSI